MNLPRLSRKVTLPNGFQYKQFNDGTIEVLAEPGWTGKTLSSEQNAAKWQAVTRQIGTWQATVGQPMQAAAVQSAQALVQSLAPQRPRPRFVPSGDAAPAAVIEPEAPSLPWGKIAMYGGIGIGGLAMILVLMKVVSGGSQEGA